MGTAIEPVEASVRRMAQVRRFVSELLGELTDRQWEELCAGARGAANEEDGITRVVLRAAALLEPSGVDVPGAVADGPPTDDGTTPPWVAAEPAPSITGPYDLLPIPSGFAAGPTPVLPYSPGPAPVPVPEIPLYARTRRGRRAHGRSGGDVRRQERHLSVTAWVRNIGAVILLFTAWQLWGTSITQHHSQTQLRQSFDAKLPGSPVPKAGVALVPADVQLPDAPLGTVVAQLQIPKIGLNQFVVSGTGSNQLSLGPGHYLGTAQPGQAGNVAIAGHRTTHGAPFNRLAELAPGDPIYLTTTSGRRFTYVVSTAPYAVSPTDVTVLNNFGDARLTLTTCNPEYSARQRLIVTAAYLPPGATHPVAIARGVGHPYPLGESLTSGWGWSLLPMVLILTALLVLLGLYNRRLAAHYGRQGRWLILVPIWTALLLALFQVLVDFLPATV